MADQVDSLSSFYMKKYLFKKHSLFKYLLSQLRPLPALNDRKYEGNLTDDHVKFHATLSKLLYLCPDVTPSSIFFFQPSCLVQTPSAYRSSYVACLMYECIEQICSTCSYVLYFHNMSSSCLLSKRLSSCLFIYPLKLVKEMHSYHIHWV